MKKVDVSIGKIYVVKVSGKLVPVRLAREASYGGWFGVNMATAREVRIRSAAKLRRELSEMAAAARLSTAPPPSSQGQRSR